MRKPDELGLTKAEWTLILDVMNGHLFLDDAILPLEGDEPQPNRDKSEILGNVAEAQFMVVNCLKHGIPDPGAFLDKLNALSDEDFSTIRAVIEGFWHHSGNPSQARIPGD